jgi:hypothetical protein
MGHVTHFLAYAGTDVQDLDTPDLPQHYEYNYDPIGNRKTVVIGADPTWEEDPLATLTYGANNLNQYTAALSGSAVGAYGVELILEMASTRAFELTPTAYQPRHITKSIHCHMLPEPN